MMREEKSVNKNLFFTTDKWPRFPVLPLKRKHDQFPQKMELGFVMASDLTKVYCGSIFETNITRLETIAYASVDDLLMDGWVVD